MRPTTFTLATLIALVALGTYAVTAPAPVEPDHSDVPSFRPSATWETRLVDVEDGDTIVVQVALWPGLGLRAVVRLRDIDAPEIRHASCDGERQLGYAAKSALAATITRGDTIFLRDVRADRFNDRVQAHVFTARGVDLGATLLHSGLVKPYDNNSGQKPDWCP